MQDIPKEVRVAIKAEETVAAFCQRILMKAAEIVGLPLKEQKLFADALIAQYPSKTNRHWIKDVTPSDRDSEIKPTDFNYLLLREYLNEHPGAGKRIVSVKQVKTMEGRIFSKSSLDELTRKELAKWRKDFIYRGGKLFSGLDAPISRTNLVPTLQALAEKPDITWIPEIMRSKGALLVTFVLIAEGFLLLYKWNLNKNSMRVVNEKRQEVT